MIIRVLVILIVVVSALLCEAQTIASSEENSQIAQNRYFTWPEKVGSVTRINLHGQKINLDQISRKSGSVRITVRDPGKPQGYQDSYELSPRFIEFLLPALFQCVHQIVPTEDPKALVFVESWGAFVNRDVNGKVNRKTAKSAPSNHATGKALDVAEISIGNKRAIFADDFEQAVKAWIPFYEANFHPDTDGQLDTEGLENIQKNFHKYGKDLGLEFFTFWYPLFACLSPLNVGSMPGEFPLPTIITEGALSGASIGLADDGSRYGGKIVIPKNLDKTQKHWNHVHFWTF